MNKNISLFLITTFVKCRSHILDLQLYANTKQVSLCLFFLFFTGSYSITAQTDQPEKTEKLSLEQVIEIACKHSPDALTARHQLRGGHWQYRSYKASFLPQLILSSALPNLKRSLTKVTQPDGTEKFVNSNYMNTNANLSLSQQIGLTGGTIRIGSSLSRIDNFSDTSVSFGTEPLMITYSQPLTTYNRFKWLKKTEPLKYEKQKKAYLSSMEEIAIQAINKFFELASAQLNYDIAKINYKNADTLYHLGNGRYTIGIIAEDELLQLELSRINSKIDVKKSELNFMQKKTELLIFLGFDKNSHISLILPSSVPELQMEYPKVLDLCYANNPEILSQQLALIEAEQQLRLKKSERGINADLSVSYGLGQTNSTIQKAYADFNTQQSLAINISVPIIDWGKRKGEYKMALSNRELAEATVQQSKLEFEQSVYNKVMQFNFENELFVAASKSDTVAQMRYTISKKRYMIGKISALELNDAQSNRDASKRNFLASIQTFWTSYYTIRKLALYDFINNKELSADFDLIVK